MTGYTDDATWRVAAVHRPRRPREAVHGRGLAQAVREAIEGAPAGRVRLMTAGSAANGDVKVSS